MPAVDLLFKETPVSQPANLVFGDVEVIGDVDIAINVPMPFALAAMIAKVVDADIVIALPALSLNASFSYAVNVARPTVGQSETDWQIADTTDSSVEHMTQSNSPTPAGWETGYQPALRNASDAEFRYADAIKSQSPGARLRHQDALRVGTWAISARHQDALRDRRHARSPRHQDALQVANWLVRTRYQDGIRDRRPRRETGYQTARLLHARRHSDFQTATPLVTRRRTRYQDAIVPPPGISPIVVVPPVDERCYFPDPDVVFGFEPATDGFLLFRCDIDSGGPVATVVVPIRSVYVVLNTISLRRVVGNVPIPTLGMSLSIDADSWTWGFSAALPYSALGDVEPDNNGPVEVEANINGTLYRLLVEKISRDRTFGNDALRISGRGKTALLSAPYSPVSNFTNSVQRTAQQLMADVLTFNAVPLGWNIDWQITDWLVPAGVFNKRGTYIDGLLSISGAAGAYLQPHPTDKEIRVLARYPTVPWEWGTVTPDYELPASVTTRESIEWIDKPVYNRVYVSGQGVGVLGRVTRQGTAGDLAAQMIVDPLITEAAAARQRGIPVISDVGRQAQVGLRLPVLAETGVITPGKFVRYVDGGTERIGIVRATGVEAGYPEVWQTISVETHESV